MGYRDWESQRNFFSTGKVALVISENVNGLILIRYHQYKAKDFEWLISALSDFQKKLRKRYQLVRS